MKLDDPELLKKPAPSYALTGPVREPYKFKSLYCRNGHCARCHLASCECDCHIEASKQLAHQLQDAGAVRQCYTRECTNNVVLPNDLFCLDCNRGNTPVVRKAKAELEALKEVQEVHLTRPL